MRVIDYADAGQRTMGNILRDQAAHIGDLPWLLMGDKVVTFAEADAEVDAVAAGLLGHGVRPGDRVPILMTDCLEYVYVFFALARIGAISVPVNTAFKGDYLRKILLRLQADAIVIDDEHWERFAALAPELPFRLACIVGHPSSELPALEVVGLDDLRRPDVRVGDVGIDHRSPLSVIFTSGTTGPSKGVVSSHHYWYSSVKAIAALRDVREGDVWYAPTPMCHAGVWMWTILPSLFHGQSVGLERRFSVSRFWSSVQHYRATQVMSIGAMNMFLLSQPVTDEERENPVRVWNPVPLPRDLWPVFKERFGVERLIYAYGQSEMSPLTQGIDVELRPGSAGWAVDHAEIQIQDDHGQPLSVGAVGEICLRPRTPGVMFDGYLDDPAATLAAFQDLWYHTGDLGRLDETGQLYFVDRKKDYLRRRGENVSSFEVEAAILEHPSVGAVAVHAIPSEQSEDEIKACVVLKDGAELEPAALAAFLDRNLPYFAVPRYIEVLAELPLTPSGKVEKYKLRSRGVTPETWDATEVGFNPTR